MSTSKKQQAVNQLREIFNNDYFNHQLKLYYGNKLPTAIQNIKDELNNNTTIKVVNFYLDDNNITDPYLIFLRKPDKYYPEELNNVEENKKYNRTDNLPDITEKIMKDRASRSSSIINNFGYAKNKFFNTFSFKRVKDIRLDDLKELDNYDQRFSVNCFLNAIAGLHNKLYPNNAFEHMTIDELKNNFEITCKLYDKANKRIHAKYHCASIHGKEGRDRSAKLQEQIKSQKNKKDLLDLIYKVVRGDYGGGTYPHSLRTLLNETIQYYEQSPQIHPSQSL